MTFTTWGRTPAARIPANAGLRRPIPLGLVRLMGCLARSKSGALSAAAVSALFSTAGSFVGGQSDQSEIAVWVGQDRGEGGIPFPGPFNDLCQYRGSVSCFGTAPTPLRYNW